jgi:hypothetical protein
MPNANFFASAIRGRETVLLQLEALHQLVDGGPFRSGQNIVPAVPLGKHPFVHVAFERMESL